MAHEPDAANQDPSSISRNGLYHCRAGQDTVHDIVARTTELFNLLKTTNASLQRTPDSEAKRAKVKDILVSIQNKFEALEKHYRCVNEICSSLHYVQVKSLIPFKDDLDNIEQIQKHRRILCTEPHPDSIREREELKRKIAHSDEQLKRITDDLRDFIYEINTMLHVSK